MKLMCLQESRGKPTARLRPAGFGVAAFAHFATRKPGLACPAVAREASEGWWGRKDSNLRSHEAADLQASPLLTKSVAYGSQIRRIGPYFRAYMAKGRTPSLAI